MLFTCSDRRTGERGSAAKRATRQERIRYKRRFCNIVVGVRGPGQGQFQMPNSRGDEPLAINRGLVSEKAKRGRQHRVAGTSIEPQTFSLFKHQVSHDATSCFDSAGAGESGMALCSAWRPIARYQVCSLRDRAAGANRSQDRKSHERSQFARVAEFPQRVIDEAIGTRSRDERHLTTWTGSTPRSVPTRDPTVRIEAEFRCRTLDRVDGAIARRYQGEELAKSPKI